MHPSDDYFFEHKLIKYAVYVFNQLVISHNVMIFEIWQSGYSVPRTFVIDKWCDHGYERFFEHILSTSEFETDTDQMFITYLWYEMIPDQPWDPSTLDFGMSYIDEPILFRCPAPFVVDRLNRMHPSLVR